MAIIHRSQIHNGAVTPAKIAGGAAGNLLVGQGTTVAPAYVAVTGALSLSAAGVVSLGAVGASNSFTSVEKTGTQTVAHGLVTIPSLAWIVVTDSNATGIYTASIAKDATNVTVTITAGCKYIVFCLK